MKKIIKTCGWVIFTTVLLITCTKKEFAPNEIELVYYNGLYFIDLKVNEIKGRFLLDTGANLSYVNYGSIDKFNLHIKETRFETELTGIGGVSEQVYSLYKFKMSELNGKELPNNIEFRSTDLSKTRLRLDGIIGSDYLKKNKGIINYSNNTLVLNTEEM